MLVDVSDPVALEPIELLPDVLRPLAAVSALVVDGFGMALELDVPVELEVPALEL